MIGSQARAKVLAYCEPVDMRKAFEGLGGLVAEALGHDPLSGTMCQFMNRRRNRAKVLYFDGTGMCALAKRLEKRRFVALSGEHIIDLDTAKQMLALYEKESARLYKRLAELGSVRFPRNG